METYTQLLTELNEKIWNFSKLKFQEHQSADAMAELLRSHGFTVTMGLADMDTAFTATYGSGKPVIGLLAEFDALSGLSQCADVTAPCPRPETENGHGCGHNLLGTACVGAALMTETQVEICFDKACSNVLSNSVLEQLLYESMLAVPLPRYTSDELAFARAIQDTFRQVAPINDLSLMGVVGPRKAQLAQRYRELPMADFVVEHRHQEINIPGSSDVGDCSHVVPTAQFIGACFAPGTPAHSWQMVAQGKSGAAVKGMLYAAQVLAHAGRTILEHPALVQQAKAEFLERTAGTPYVCPIPPEILPNRHARP